jgi:DMSO/TMAO reductase YedYZ molybdopterin-dependent catalytic subunit
LKKLEKLPVFPSKNLPEYKPESWRLVIDGLVSSPLALTGDEVLEYSTTALTSDFSCIEGWMVEDIKWLGIRVRDLLEKTSPLPAAKYVTFHAGPFVMSLPIDDAMKDNIVLASQMDGKMLPREHGGPLRLITPLNDCFYSVKWVNRVELAASDANDTGREIALARIRRE